MRIVLFVWLAIALFSLPHPVSAADSDIVINEIGGFEKGDHEWIELYNKGAEPVDLTGWKFVEDQTAHGLSEFRGGMVLGPGQYAVIADVSANTQTDHPEFAGVLIDSSWSTLSGNGELIGLKTKQGALLESFAYLAFSKYSLERIDSNISDYSASNWKEHASGSTIGSKNSASPKNPSVEPKETPAQQATSTPSPPVPAQPASTTTPSAEWKPTRGDIVINEFVADPADEEKEWIELYNKTDQVVSLEGWTIEDGSRSVTRLSGELGNKGAERFFLIEGPVGSLNNFGDMLILRDGDKMSIDEVSYGSWDDGNAINNAPSARDPHSVARLIDGMNTYNNSNDFRVTTRSTKKESNVIVEEESDRSQKTTSASTKVVISELLPNPQSHEANDEYIELLNEGDKDVSLTDWELVASSGMKYRIRPTDGIQTNLAPGAFVVLYRSVSRLALKNAGGESVKLYAPDGERAHDILSYRETAPQGHSFARTGGGKAEWTTALTPGNANRIERDNQKPTIVLHLPKSIYAHEVAIFDASDTADPDGEAIFFEWNFSDGIASHGAYQSHLFSKEGTYAVTLTVRAGADEVKKEERVQVRSRANSQEGKRETAQTNLVLASGPQDVFLNEILPNPKGADTAEFVEVKNASAQARGLSGWTLRSDAGVLFSFSNESLAPNGFIVLDKGSLKKALKNAGEHLYLLNAQGALVDEVAYEDAPSGQAFARTSLGDWLWTEKETRLAENKVDYYYESEPLTEDQGVHDYEELIQEEKAVEAVAKGRKQKGQQVQVTGVVSVQPGQLGKSIFYLESPPVEVYSSGFDLPKLVIGDRVSVVGALSKKDGNDRIRLGKTGALIMKGHEKPPEPMAAAFADIEDDMTVGQLVRVAGTVTEVRWPRITLDDGDDMLELVIKRSTGIRRADIIDQANIEVIGIVQRSGGTYQVLPRSKPDLTRQKSRIGANGEPTTLNLPGHGDQTKRVKTYLLVAVLFFTALSAGLYIRSRNN